MELWDEETGTDIHPIGIYTLPEMELPFDDMGTIMAEIRRVAAAILEHGKFPIVLGGEHSITSPVVAAVAAKYPGLSVLQIDAHADLRDTYMGTRFNHACAMRRVLEHAPLHAGGHPQHVDGRGEGRAERCRRRFSTTSTCARTRTGLPEGRRIAWRHGLHHDRRRWDGPGDHAGHRDTPSRAG